jgi:hypothetical protein
MNKNGFVGINHCDRCCQADLAMLQSEFVILVFLLHPPVWVLFVLFWGQKLTERATLGSIPTPVFH